MALHDFRSLLVNYLISICHREFDNDQIGQNICIWWIVKTIPATTNRPTCQHLRSIITNSFKFYLVHYFLGFQMIFVCFVELCALACLFHFFQTDWIVPLSYWCYSRRLVTHTRPSSIGMNLWITATIQFCIIGVRAWAVDGTMHCMRRWLMPLYMMHAVCTVADKSFALFLCVDAEFEFWCCSNYFNHFDCRFTNWSR